MIAGVMMLTFRILGPIEAWDADRPIDLGGPKPRRVLAALLLEAGRVVAVERLVDAVWDADPPATARRQVQNAVSALRQAGIGAVLVPQGPGYTLRLSREQVDALRFEDAVSRAAAAREVSDLAGAAVTLRSGLALWRGSALAGVGGPVAEAAGAQLEERRLAALTTWAEIALDLGVPAVVVDELRATVDAYPLREPLARLLMLALHRCGRTADALVQYQLVRRALGGALGVEPGPELQELYKKLLALDPTLDYRQVASPGRNDLPREVAGFTGRSTELARLMSVLDAAGPAGMVAIDGMAGVGKTALAVYAGHRLAERYPDGQLFLDLHGHTPEREQMTSESALDALLRAVGVTDDSVLKDVDEKAARWRAELAGRRVLVVLDNASGSAQIRPLLPSSARSALLVTSRRRLIGLPWTDVLSLDILPDADAVALFDRIVGPDRTDDAAEPVMRVIQLCGHLPLAIGLAAARLRSRPQWTAEHLSARLDDERGRLALLEAEDYGVTTAFALSYQYLPPEQQRLFRLLSVHPGPDIDTYAAAALAGLPLTCTAALLEGLCDLHLLVSPTPDRYRFHDLVRGYAKSSAAEVAEPDLDQAVYRLLDYYLGVTEAAVDLVLPDRRRLGPPPNHPPAYVPRLPEASDARKWLRAEHGNLLAVARLATRQGTTEHGWQIPRNVSAYLWLYGDLGMGAAVQEIALAACRPDTDPVVRTTCLFNLALIYQTIGRYASALECLDQSVALARQSGDRAGEASCMTQMADIYNHVGEFTRALTLGRRAMEIFRTDGQRVREAEALVSVVEALVRLERSTEAIDAARPAMVVDLGNDQVTGALLSRLGTAYSRLGGHDIAVDLLSRSVEIARRDEDQVGQESYLCRLAGALRRAGRSQEALACGVEALGIMAQITNPADLCDIHNVLGAIHADLGHYEEALAHYQSALAAATGVGYRVGEDDAGIGIAKASGISG